MARCVLLVRMMDAPSARSRRRLLATLPLLAIGGVAALGVLDERSLGSGIRLEISREQQVLATVLAGELRTRLKELERRGAGGPVDVIDGVWRFGEDDAAALEPGRIGAQFPADDERLLLLWRSGTHELRTFEGELVSASSVARAASERAARATLPAGEAADLGLPESPAVVGLASFYAGSLGDWTVAVVSSTERQRFREGRRYVRTLLMVSLASLVILGYCLVLLRSQRQDRALLREGQRFDRESALARESREAAMLTFATGVAHDLSTPLGVIAMRAEQIENWADEESIRRSARTITEQIDRIRTHARRFLAITRGVVPLCERFVISEVVQGATVRVQHRFERADVKLMISACNRPTPLCGDARLLEQSLVDLLLRACEVSPPGAEVSLSVSRTEGDLIVTINDRGPKRLPAMDGRGRLDLLIASEVMRIHRGELAFVENSDGGTRVTLRVPVDTEAESEVSIIL